MTNSLSREDLINRIIELENANEVLTRNSPSKKELVNRIIELENANEVLTRNLEFTKTNLHNTKLRLDLTLTKLHEKETKADHLDILMNVVKENDLVRNAWDKFTMTLRMTGYDKSE